MQIDFTRARWDTIKENADRWWRHDLKRPLMSARMPGGDPGRHAPRTRGRLHQMLYDETVPINAIVDMVDYDLSSTRYLGDAFPAMWPNMGPGCLTAFAGGRAVTDDDTVWFYPDAERDLADIKLRYIPDNPSWQRLLAFCGAAMARWHGMVQVGMTDLGGTLDVLSAFRPSEKLLLDLYDSPDEVKRLASHIHDIWWQYYDLQAAAMTDNPGFTGWLPIFSDGPFYVLQCDFCYMIGPDMFDEFVKPELAASCKRLAHCVYHLDGIGELPHLDSLLAIPELGGIQWVYGDGKPGVAEWPDIYRRVLAAGKLLWLHATPAQFDKIVSEVGTSEGILLEVTTGGDTRPSISEVREFMEKYGVS